MSNIAKHSEKLVAEVKRRALDFVCDNPKLAGIRIHIESAMLIGASIVHELESGQELYDPLPGQFKATGKFLLPPTTEEQEASSRPLGEG